MGELGSREAALDSSLSYIPHLDGIRAVAVVIVCLFHFEVWPFRGGFVGVDVFFVLSGFLMTRRLRHAMSTDENFSFLAFYSARFWRLYPSCLVTVAVTVFAAFYYFPEKLARDTLISGLATLTVVSNALFASQRGGYFDSGSIRKPLLHMWSLSLEEQFYLVWPLLLWITSVRPGDTKRRPSLVSSLSFVMVASFGLSSLLSRPEMHPHFSWFHLPTRAHEFGFGACALLLYDSCCQLSRSKSTLLSCLGFTAILASSIFLQRDEDRRSDLNFPGWASLPCLLGSVALIVFPRSHLCGTGFLSSKPMMFVGKISYSVYLVHWPVWVFLKWMMVSHPAIFGTLLTLCLGLLLHFAVEKKLRSPACAWRTTAVLLTLGVILVVSLYELWPQRTLGYYEINKMGCQGPWTLSGKPMRLLDIQLMKANQVRLKDMDWLQWNDSDREITAVGFDVTRRQPEMVVVGDSYASNICEVVGSIRETGYTICLTIPGCYIDLAEYGYPQERDQPCKPDVDSVRKILLSLNRSVKVIVSHDWQGKFHSAGNRRPLEDLVVWLQKQAFGDIVILGDHPRTDLDVPDCMHRQSRGEHSNDCTGGVPTEGDLRTQKYMETYAETTNASVVSLHPAFCGGYRCEQVLCGVSLYVDHMHFSPQGSLVAGNVLYENLLN